MGFLNLNCFRGGETIDDECWSMEQCNYGGVLEVIYCNINANFYNQICIQQPFINPVSLFSP